MKLFGGSKNSRHAGGGARHTDAAPKREQASPARPAAPRKADGPEDYDDRLLPTWAKVFIVVVTVLIILVAGTFIYFKLAAKPPVQTGQLNNVNNTSQPQGSGQNTPNSDGENVQDNNGAENNDGDESGESNGGTDGQKTGRNENMYTFIVVGKDKVGSNTDTMMLARFDAENYTLNVVSIPRDTYMNTTYRNKKANTLYGSGGADGLMDNIANFIGFRPDGYAVVNLDAFIKLIDAIGGVTYYVPRDMDYDDEYQDLHIHFKKGSILMDGQKAMEYVRFRHGYANQDIGRIDAQHDFLMTAAQQVLANRDKVPITTLVSIFLSDVKTDLKLEECTWLAAELLKMDAENIHFATMPGNYNDYYNKRNYVTVDIEAWIEMLNEYLNPFYEQITAANLDVAGRDENGKMYSTSGTIY